MGKGMLVLGLAGGLVWFSWGELGELGVVKKGRMMERRGRWFTVGEEETRNRFPFAREQSYYLVDKLEHSWCWRECISASYKVLASSLLLHSHNPILYIIHI